MYPLYWVEDKNPSLKHHSTSYSPYRTTWTRPNVTSSTVSDDGPILVGPSLLIVSMLCHQRGVAYLLDLLPSYVSLLRRQRLVNL